MQTPALPTTLLILGLLTITGAFSFVTKKIGAIAVWGLTAILILVSLTFGYQLEVIMGLATMSFLISTIVVVIDG